MDMVLEIAAGVFLGGVALFFAAVALETFTDWRQRNPGQAWGLAQGFGAVIILVVLLWIGK